ncbi:MAG: hypothetical protein V1820_00525, partial [archaeon]
MIFPLIIAQKKDIFAPKFKYYEAASCFRREKMPGAMMRRAGLVILLVTVPILAGCDINTPHYIDIGGATPTPTTEAPPTPTEWLPPTAPADEVLALEQYYPANLVEAAEYALESSGFPKSSEHPDESYFEPGIVVAIVKT